MADGSTTDPPRLVATGYDTLAGTFDAWAANVEDPARDRLLGEFVRRLPKDARVLDVGCGTASTWTDEQAADLRITGIDISAGQIDGARRRLPNATFLHGDVRTIDLPPRSSDGITALYAIGHVPSDEQERVFDRFVGWLEPGGLLLASLPSDPDPGWTGRWIGDVDMFFASLGAERYLALLDAAGWTVVHSSVEVANEPEGTACFLWVLAEAPR